MKTLRQAKIGDTLKVVKLHGEGAVKRRIMDMGITRGGWKWLSARWLLWAIRWRSRSAAMSCPSAKRTLT